MKAEEITKGSTLLATLNKENYPFGMHKDLIEDLNRMINLALNMHVVSRPLPSRKDYDNRKLKPMYFTKDTAVGNSVLFIKGEEWQPYNWNYKRTIDYLKEGRLGYDC